MKYSCAQHTQPPSEVEKAVDDCTVVSELSSGLGQRERRHTNPSPCNVFSSPHASCRIQELTNVVITVFKLGFYFFKLLQGKLSRFPKAKYPYLFKHLVYLKILSMSFK